MSEPRTCDRKECGRVAGWRPVIVFKNNRGARVRAVCGLVVCPIHARGRKPEEVILPAEIAKLRAALARQARIVSVSVRLEWIHLTSDESRLYDKQCGPSPPS